MIRVLYVVETIGSGGVERRRLSLAKLLDKSQYELKIICTKFYGSIADEIRDCGVEVIDVGCLTSFFDFDKYRKVVKIINEFKPHIIHGAVFEGVSMASVCGFIKNVPIIIIEETSDPQNRSWKGNLLMKFFSMISNKTIGVSPATTNYLINKIGVSKNKVELINNGVALPKIINDTIILDLKKELNIQEGKIVIGTVGRLFSDSNKRYSDLIKGFSFVLKNGIDAVLVIVGDGKELENYKLLAKELNITEKIIFAGFQNDIDKYYEIFDVFSLVSAHESFGLVLAEAMLHKLPVVATKVGGMQYIVDDNQTGFLVEKYNIDEIARKLEILCNNKEMRKSFGENGYNKAIEKYTEDRYVNDINKLYLSLKNKMN